MIMNINLLRIYFFEHFPFHNILMPMLKLQNILQSF